MKRVLGVVGSPRQGGNTHLLVERTLEGARAAGAETDLLMLGGLRIRECDGCHVCWSGRPCAKRDDMNPLYERIAVSTAIAFGTPVYWYGPTALLKAFLDRFVYFNCPENRPKIRGRAAGLLVPFEDRTAATADLTVQLLQQSLAYLEMNFAGHVLVPGLQERGEVAQRSDAMQAAFELGRKLADAAE